MKRIRAFAFEHCDSLTNITIPSSVTSISGGAFYKCGLLKTINYKGTKKQWYNIDKEKLWKTHSLVKVIHCIDGDVELSNQNLNLSDLPS